MEILLQLALATHIIPQHDIPVGTEISGKYNDITKH
jgi:hypothetical protein